jgi:hypothetical protein
MDSLPPFPQRPKQHVEPEHTVGHNLKTCLILAQHRKVEKSLNMLLHFLDILPKQIHNIAYNPVGIFILRKLGANTSGTSSISHNSREPNYNEIYYISRCFAVQNWCSFYSIQER